MESAERKDYRRSLKKNGQSSHSACSACQNLLEAHRTAQSRMLSRRRDHFQAAPNFASAPRRDRRGVPKMLPPGSALTRPFLELEIDYMSGLGRIRRARRKIQQAYLPQ